MAEFDNIPPNKRPINLTGTSFEKLKAKNKQSQPDTPGQWNLDLVVVTECLNNGLEGHWVPGYLRLMTAKLSWEWDQETDWRLSPFLDAVGDTTPWQTDTTLWYQPWYHPQPKGRRTAVYHSNQLHGSADKGSGEHLFL